MTEAIEQGNRRAEIGNGEVVFLRLTGRVRRSKQAVWRIACDGLLAYFLAEQWVKHRNLPLQ
jgi:hypothetical protein